jgi:hypothetical protein
MVTINQISIQADEIKELEQVVTNIDVELKEKQSRIEKRSSYKRTMPTYRKKYAKIEQLERESIQKDARINQLERDLLQKDAEIKLAGLIKLERQIGALRLTQERDVRKHDEESNKRTDRRLDSNEWKDTHP